MKIFIIFLIFIVSSIKTFCQVGFETSLPCHRNVNSTVADEARALEKKAVFMFKVNKLVGRPGFCTSTLINRDMNLDNMGFYFVTATHCIVDDNDNLDIDLGVEHDLVFNFQSPNHENNATALSNRGDDESQSLSLGDDGFQYLHRSRLRLVEHYTRNDFAIFEILKPIPPHFQVNYAGWSTGGPQFIFNPLDDSHYAVIHQPSGDIKKISKTNWVLGGNPISNGCRAVTKIIDGLFGWIWGRRWSTEVVCGFIENTHATVVQWNVGNTEPGSSGSTLLNNNNRIIGVLTGDATPITTTCGNFQGLKRFGKFRTSYFKQTVKNTLNPSNSYWTDQFGIGGRKIDCFHKLENLGGQYFPASDYQADNVVTLRSATTATLSPTETITVHPGADYRIVAQSFSMGFNTQIAAGPAVAGRPAGSVTISTTPASCVVTRGEEMTEQEKRIAELVERAKDIKLPTYKPLDLAKQISGTVGEANLQVFPNPSSDGNFTLRFVAPKESESVLTILDLMGRVIHTQKLNTLQGENFHSLNLTLAKGVYLARLNSSDNFQLSEKIIVQ